MSIAVAISFDSGILLCADTKDSAPSRIHAEPTRIFPKLYSSSPAGARSIFVISAPVDYTVAAFRHCERALDLLQPAEYTIGRMRATIEEALVEAYEKRLESERESGPEATLLVALYSPADQASSLFRASGTVLVEFVGYDCQGPAAYLGHYLIRDRYRAADSMDSLDLTTVSSIAMETLERVRESFSGCGESTETLVMYANGRATDVQGARPAIRKRRKVASRSRRVASPA